MLACIMSRPKSFKLCVSFRLPSSFFTVCPCLYIAFSRVEFKASHLISEDCVVTSSPGRTMTSYKGNFVCSATSMKNCF